MIRLSLVEAFIHSITESVINKLVNKHGAWLV